MRHMADTAPLPAARRGQARARAAVIDDRRSSLLRALRLMLPLVLLVFLALGQAASAHQGAGPHQPQVVKAMSHHADAADAGCCGDMAQDEDSRACLAQCLASCSYCAPVPLPANFPDLTAHSPAPAPADPLHGAIASPHLRPPSIS